MPRSLIATDDFNRAGPALGANWAQLNAGNRGDVVIDSSIRASGQFGPAGVVATAQTSSARWVANSFSDDQYAKLVLRNPLAVSGNPYHMGVLVRASSDVDNARDYYDAVVFQDSATTPTTALRKWVNGTCTVLHSAAQAWAADDTISLEVVGSTLTVFRNDTSLGGSFVQTDTAITTGRPGIVVCSSLFADDWEGGDITAGAPSITAHPVGGAAAVGATTQYSITETGATSYQWQVSTNGGETWTNVVGGSGATTATYTTPTTTAADNGKQYRCVATNANGSTNSLGAWFHVSGIGLTGRGRWTSRGRIPVWLPDSSPVLLTRDILTAPHPNDTKSDNIASAFRDLYFYADPAASVAAAEFPHWTWSTQNRPGSGPLSTGVFYVSQQRVWAPSSSDATVSLTGVSATGSAGTLGVTVDKALTGVAATGGVGALTASISAALSGAQAATGAGGLGPTVSVAISGAGATASVGDVAPSAAGSVAISGVSSTGAAGSLSADVSLALGGLQASGEVGSLPPSREISVSGVSAASAAGSLSASVSVALSGQAAASAAGTVSLGGDVSIAISGVSATGLVGSVSPLGAEASGGWPIAAMVSEMRRRKAREAERLKALEEEERKREQALTHAKSVDAKQKARAKLEDAKAATERQERLLALLIQEIADAMRQEAEAEEEREILEILAEWM